VEEANQEKKGREAKVKTRQSVNRLTIPRSSYDLKQRMPPYCEEDVPIQHEMAKAEEDHMQANPFKGKRMKLRVNQNRKSRT